jgi:probable O-glycosylation ligase (exosortase A-associated)
VRDLLFIAYLGGLFALGFRRPFMFVLVYAYIDIVSPQRLTYFLLNTVPVSMIAAVLAIGGWLVTDRGREVKVAPRQILMVLLLGYCWLTTRQAEFPEAALDKWDWAWKAMFFAAFLPFTLTTRLRVEALAVCMTLSASFIIIVGGIKTVAGGGGYGTLNLASGDSGLYESSTISCIAICIIPLILYLRKYGTIFPKDRWVSLFCFALVFACLVLPIGTTARTGLICIAALGVLMLRAAKRRFTYIAWASVVLVLTIPMLPATYTKRMATITNPKADQSAGTRLAVWGWTWNYVQEHPFGGGFAAYKGNKIKIEVVKQASEGGQTEVEATIAKDKARAYHSAYFEMLGEQGFPGLALWLSIHLIGLVRMQVLRRRYLKSGTNEDLRWIGAFAEALQHGQLIYLAGALFIGIAIQPFIFMLLALQIGLDSYAKRLDPKPLVDPKPRRPKLAV